MAVEEGRKGRGAARTWPPRAAQRPGQRRPPSSRRRANLEVREPGFHLGGRGRRKPHPFSGDKMRLPGLTALCTAGAASHILAAGHKGGQRVSPSPQSRTGFPQKTPQHNSLFILQVLSHMTTSTNSPCVRGSKGDRSPQSPAAPDPPSPRPSNGPPPIAPAPAHHPPEGLRGPPDPRPWAPLSSQHRRARTEREKEPSQAPSPLPVASPGTRRRTMVCALQVYEPGG